MKHRSHVRLLFVAVLALLSLAAMSVAWASDQAPSGPPAIAALTDGSPVTPSTAAQFAWGASRLAALLAPLAFVLARSRRGG